MKLTNRTTPQARNFQCNECKRITCHIEMYDDNICNDCYDKTPEEQERLNNLKRGFQEAMKLLN
ncbi:MAG: hypothetical protein WC758_08150 [Candidatus Woesearchaeota archaeon]|jgi:hypothetical protein